MNFNSLPFLVFLPTVILGYSLVFSRPKMRTGWLLLASYFFYMSWNWKYAGLILVSTLIDYVVAQSIANSSDQSKRKQLLIVSLALNLGVLGFFKYHNFFVNETFGLLSWFGLHLEPSLFTHSFLLPVGVSFYTFQSLSYTIDIYRREIAPERDFAKFALFIAFFPQLVAGPIVRASEFLPQLQITPSVSRERVTTGVGLIFRGLFKKIVFADLLASLGVDAVFADPISFSSLTLLLALYGYAFQIYNDFSGYSDIAIGSARVLGFDFPANFSRPYLARNVRDFWTRWHISLSSWLRDYLYIPLGGNRGTAGRVRINLLLTMLLGGLWHGAATNFVLWGAWHGLLLVLARSQNRVSDGTEGMRAWIERAACFHLIVFSWLLFRVSSLDQLSSFLAGMSELSVEWQLSPLFVSVLLAAALSHFSPKRWMDGALVRVARLPTPVQGFAYAGLLVLFSGLSVGAPVFIYFQF